MFPNCLRCFDKRFCRLLKRLAGQFGDDEETNWCEDQDQRGAEN